MRFPFPLLVALALAPALALGQATLPASPSPAAEKPKAPGQASRTARPAPTRVKPPTTLEVVVQDPRGQPVAGALVAIGTGRELMPRPHSGRTDAEGRVRLEKLPRPPWDVAIQARGLAPKRLERIDGTKPLRVRLEPGAVLTGTVRDGTTREPVAGASVWVSVRSGVAAQDTWDPDAGRVAARTDARGRFKLDGLGSGPATVNATAPGAGRAIRPNVLPGSAVELFLMPGATISGTVRDDAGKPVKGAVVRAMPEGFGPFLPPAERADAGGRFVIAGLEAGSYVLVAREGTRAPAVAAVRVEATGDAGADLTLAEGGFITGRLVDAGGKPVAGRVRLSSVDGTLLHVLLQDLVQTQAGTDGRFVLGPTPPGELVLKASAAGLAPRDVETASGNRTRGTDLGDVVLESGPVIRGVFQDRQGAGIPGATIRAFTRGPSLPAEAESDEAGAFVLAGLPAGTVDVTARAPGYASARQAVAVGTEDLVIALDAGGTVVGAVVDGKGQPVSGAMVRAAAETREMDAPPMGLTSDGDGRFSLYDVRPGRYVVDARAAGHPPGNVSGVRVSAGATTDVGTLRLRSGGVLQGTVTDSTNDPISGASVRVETDSFGPGLQTQTDGAGAFQIAGLSAGRVDVVAQHPAYAPARLSGVTIDTEGRPAEAAVVMTRGGRVEGVVRRRGGQPFSDGRVMVVSRREMRGFDPRSAQPIREDGSFVLEHVPPGPSWLSVLSADATRSGAFGGGFQTVIQRELEVVDGETTVVDVQTREVLLTGRVTRAGEPAAGLAITFTAAQGGYTMYSGAAAGTPSAAPGPQLLTGVTREDGSYELLVLEPGRYRAMRRTPDGVTSPLMSGNAPFIEVPDVPSHTADFTLGSARVAGIVVEQDSGKPIARAFVSFTAKATQGSGMSDAEGRFAIEAEPGDGKLRIRAEGFAPEERALSVGETGLDELRVELTRGLEIAGRVVDPTGRPVGDLQVLARSEADNSTSGFGRALPDGTFRVRGLGDGAYTVSAGSDRAGFGYQAGVLVGATDVRLTLHPASSLRVRVVDVNGQPVAKAMARIEKIGGTQAMFPGRTGGTTDQAGILELVAPEGLVTLFAQAEGRSGRAAVECRGGAPASAEVVLSETPAKGPPPR